MSTIKSVFTRGLNVLGISLALVLLLAKPALAEGAHTVPLSFETPGLAWSAAEVSRATQGAVEGVLNSAGSKGQLGCRRHCERISAVWDRLVMVLPRSARADTLKLHFVQSKNEEAFATPAGDVVVSEAFVDSGIQSDEELAFVLAHEMAHVLLQHERQTLTEALNMLPEMERSVTDVYVEMQYRPGLVGQLTAAFHRVELEADEFGLLLAAYAGFAPQKQLAFLRRTKDIVPTQMFVPTHPSYGLRFQRAAAHQTLAENMFQLGAMARGQ